jgi:hypothetical protein
MGERYGLGETPVFFQSDEVTGTAESVVAHFAICLICPGRLFRLTEVRYAMLEKRILISDLPGTGMLRN